MDARLPRRARRGPRAGAAGGGPAALAWMGERQVQLADTIFAMDRRAKEAELARGGPDAIADAPR